MCHHYLFQIIGNWSCDAVTFLPLPRLRLKYTNQFRDTLEWSKLVLTSSFIKTVRRIRYLPL